MNISGIPRAILWTALFGAALLLLGGIIARIGGTAGAALKAAT